MALRVIVRWLVCCLVLLVGGVAYLGCAQSTVSDGFEQGFTSSRWEVKSWIITSDVRRTGDFAARAVGDGYLELILETPGGGEVSFWYRVEGDDACLRFTVLEEATGREVVVDEWKGHTGWKEAKFAVPPGTYQIIWTASGDLGWPMQPQKGVWLDDLKLVGLRELPWTASEGQQQVVVRPGESIQRAIDAASPGTLIIVEPGEYRENLVLRKRADVRGAGADKTKILALGGGPAVRIEAADASLSGLAVFSRGDWTAVEMLTGSFLTRCRLVGSGSMGWGVDVRGAGAWVRDCVIEGFGLAGINVRNDSSAVVMYTVIRNGGPAVSVGVKSRARVLYCLLTGNQSGVAVEYLLAKQGDTQGPICIEYNEISHNRAAGIGILGSRNVTCKLSFYRNAVFGNTGGIYATEIFPLGPFFDYLCSGTGIQENAIYGNAERGIFWTSYVVSQFPSFAKDVFRGNRSWNNGAPDKLPWS